MTQGVMHLTTRRSGPALLAAEVILSGWLASLRKAGLLVIFVQY